MYSDHLSKFAYARHYEVFGVGEFVTVVDEGYLLYSTNYTLYAVTENLLGNFSSISKLNFRTTPMS